MGGSGDFRVPKYRYPAQFEGGERELLGRIEELLLRGGYVLGEEVAEFEERLAGYLGAAHTIGVNSGTDALILALDALGIGPGDEVVTVANSFHATAQAVARRGATPVYVDCRALASKLVIKPQPPQALLVEVVVYVLG